MDKITIEEGLAINGYYISTIVGDSMMPMLRNRRDTVKIVPAETPLKKYDLPLYRRPTGECVLHRIVKVKKAIILFAEITDIPEKKFLLNGLLVLCNHFTEMIRRYPQIIRNT